MTLRSIVTDVLTWIGLGPLAVHVPVPPLSVPPLLEGMWLSIRRLQFTVNNQRPGAQPTTTLLNPYSGLTSGDLNAVDYEGDPLTYTVGREPQQGTLVIDPDGTFTYRPSETLAVQGGTDSFVVTIDDTAGNPPHTYGLLGALVLIGPTTVRVTVRIAPIDQSARILVAQAHDDFAHALRRRTEAGEHAAQAATEQNQAGQLRDAAAAILANNPDPQMKADAAELIELAQQHEAQAGAQRELETIARREAQTSYLRGIDRIAQALAMDPDIDVGEVPDWDAAEPPTIVVTAGQPGTDGAITYHLAASRPVSYAVTAAPAHGQLTADADGSYVYRPDRTYAHAVGAGGPDSDTFTVTADDGLGGSATVTVAVTVPFVNDAPGGPAPTVGTPAAGTGAVLVTTHFTDFDGDAVEYTVTTPVNGELADNGDGTYTYTPTAGARTAAGNPDATDADRQDTFTVVATDGHSTTTVTVTVPVLPAATAAAIDVGRLPVAVAFNSSGTRAYVANDRYGEIGYEEPPSVSVIDTASNLVIATIELTDDYLNGVVISPDGSRLYVPISDRDHQGKVAVIDTTTSTVLGVIQTGFAAGIAMVADGTRVYVGSDDAVLAIDTATNTVVGSIPVSGIPTDLVVSPDGDLVYVADSRSYRIAVIDTRTGMVSYTPSVGSYGYGVAISPDGTKLYVAGSYDLGMIAVVDTATLNVTHGIVVGGAPHDITVSPDGSTVYVANFAYKDEGGGVWVFDTATATVTGTLVGGQLPEAVTVSPDGSRILVANRGDGTVSMLPVG